MPRLPRSLPVMLVTLLLAGCASLPPAEQPTPTAGPEAAGDLQLAHGQPYTLGHPPGSAPAPEPPPVVRLAFVGDILPGGSLAGLLAQRGADYPWQHVAPLLQQADLAIGNLETAVSTRGTPEPDKQFTFRSHPDTLGGAARAGIDVLSLANNHSLDYGPEALLETIAHLKKAGIQPVGAGRDLAEAARPLIVEVRGLRLAFLAFSRVIPATHWVAREGHPGTAPGWDPQVVLEATRKARQEADAVIVLLHWGEEVQDEPRPADVTLAHQLRENGATLVVGHHPHILQRIDWRDRRLVAYSLGNFIFPTVPRRLNQETGILQVTLDPTGVTEAHFTPFYITEGQPRPVQEDDGGRIMERLDRLSRRCGTRAAPDGALTPAREEPPPDC